MIRAQLNGVNKKYYMIIRIALFAFYVCLCNIRSEIRIEKPEVLNIISINYKKSGCFIIYAGFFVSETQTEKKFHYHMNECHSFAHSYALYFFPNVFISCSCVYDILINVIFAVLLNK